MVRKRNILFGLVINNANEGKKTGRKCHKISRRNEIVVEEEHKPILASGSRYYRDGTSAVDSAVVPFLLLVRLLGFFDIKYN